MPYTPPWEYRTHVSNSTLRESGQSSPVRRRDETIDETQGGARVRKIPSNWRYAESINHDQREREDPVQRMYVENVDHDQIARENQGEPLYIIQEQEHPSDHEHPLWVRPVPIDESQSPHARPMMSRNERDRAYERRRHEEELRPSLQRRTQTRQPSNITELQADNEKLTLELAKVENRHEALLKEGTEILIKHEELKRENKRLKDENHRLRMISNGREA